MINTCWGSELAQSIIWGLPGRGGSRHLPFGPARADCGGVGRAGLGAVEGRGGGGEPHRPAGSADSAEPGPGLLTVHVPAGHPAA